MIRGRLKVPLANSWNVGCFSFPLWSWVSSGRKFSCSATGASSVLLLWVFSCPCLGSDLGRNQKGILDSRITVPVTMKPSHQAPTQRESLWLILMVSEIQEKKRNDSQGNSVFRKYDGTFLSRCEGTFWAAGHVVFFKQRAFQIVSHTMLWNEFDRLNVRSLLFDLLDSKCTGSLILSQYRL